MSKVERYKPKTIKGMSITYDGKEYNKITYLGYSNDYVNFSYLDENDSECSISCNDTSKVTIN